MPASDQRRFGRKRSLPACPNPLFLQWLTELRDQAKERSHKTQHVYQKAISSLKKYPLPLQNAREAKILQNFGDGICKILDEKLQRYYRENGPDAPIHSLPPGINNNNSILAPPKALSSGSSNQRRAQGKAEGEGGRRRREYIPQRRSGGYAVLLTLYRQSQVPGSKGFMFKMELQEAAQMLCDKSFSVPDLGSKYTAWASVSTLIQKDLLLKTHNPARYSLTDLGLALARRLDSGEREGEQRRMTGEREQERRGEEEEEEEREQERRSEEEEEEEEDLVDLTMDEDNEENVVQKKKRPNLPACSAQSRSEEAGLGCSGKAQASDTQRRPPGAQLHPGCYDIILCVDFIETTGGSTAKKQELVKELQRNRVTFDIRKLNIGDFLWVARERVAPVAGQLCPPPARELVLDYIVERKRMDDLCGSIIDGRFREQKFRMKRCGLRRLVYLVEECGTAASHLSLPESTLQQAIINTQVVDGFYVKRVQDVRESAAYLTFMTRYLTKLYQCQTVREVFARQLMQISGLSGDKAAAILEHYTTLSSLLSVYEGSSSETEKEKLLSSIRYGKLQRKLGPALSRSVYQLYATQGALP